MPSPLYFIQECPTCGRSLQIRVGYLGRQVVCQHCNGQFQAYDEGAGVPPPPSASESGTALMRRADELLDAVRQRQWSTQ